MHTVAKWTGGGFIGIATTAVLLPCVGSLARLPSSLRLLCFALFLLAGSSFWIPTCRISLGCRDVTCFLRWSWSQGSESLVMVASELAEWGWEGLPTLGSAPITKISPNELRCLNWGRKLSPLISTKTDFSVESQGGGWQGARGQNCVAL